MKLFQTERVPEPEVMDEAAEVEAYTSAAAQAYLEQIDRTFVDHVARLFGGEPRGLALDLGCGPGQIPIMMAKRWPALRIVGLDAAPHMIEQARKNAAQAKVAVTFQIFRASSTDTNGAGRLPFDTGSFDLVTCNSVLHHLSAPVPVLDEIARVAKPRGAVLLRDLRRPAGIVMAPHTWWYGRHYSGEMKRLYTASVRAAYTSDELCGLLSLSRLNDGRSRVFQHARTHLGIERTAA